MFEHHQRVCIVISLFLTLLTPGAFAQSAVKAPPAPAVNSQWMVGLFSDGAKALLEKTKEASDRAGQVQSSLANTTKQLRELQLKMAILKTAMEVKSISPPIVDQILNTYSANEAQLSSEASSLTGEIEALKKRRAKDAASEAAIGAQTQILKSSTAPDVWSAQIELAYGQYQDAEIGFAAATSQLLNALTKELQLVKQQKELLDGVLPRLNSLQQAFMAQLLQRGQTQSFWRQLGELLSNVGALPGSAWRWFSGLLRSGQIQAFLLKRLAPLTGLLFLIAFLVWITRHVKYGLDSLMKRIRPNGKDIGVRLLISLTCSLIALVHPIAFIVWLTVAYGILGLFGAAPALILLYTLAGLLVLAILIRVVRDIFCVSRSGKCGIRQIKEEKARLLCLHLEIYLAYVVLGFVATAILWLDNFPITAKLFISHLYELGVLVWTCVLLRPHYLKKIIARPHLHTLGKWLRLLWTALLLLLVAVLFMELLGFQSLSIYAVNAAVLTEAIIAGALLLAGIGRGVLRELFERENVFFKNHKAARVKLKQFYLPIRLVLSTTLIAGLIAGLLRAWGIGIKSLTVFVDHLGKGVDLGSLHLSPLNILTSTLVLYVVFRGSSLARTFLRDRILPRTGWDLGVQYSIATILQYAIIISGVLLAMNILGFPLASLALLAGAMGIGAGLGLQNVIANFVSGLVLLFERPVKVGDMLVVDGQWGEVKAIKMRSTVFQTYDRYVLIIPNSDLLSGKIVNWTHYGIGPNRLTLKVGVGYNSDVKMVTELLREICSANPLVMEDPAPQIFFQAYGDSSLDFNILVFVRVPGDRNPVTHEINTAIFEAFRERGIEIPFPQRDLHIIDERRSLTEEAQKDGPDLPGPDSSHEYPKFVRKL